MSSGERKRRSPNRRDPGFWTAIRKGTGEGKRIERRAREGESPVPEARSRTACSGVGRDTRNPVRRRGDRPARLNTVRLPIANEYREGKVKRTPGGE